MVDIIDSKSIAKKRGGSSPLQGKAVFILKFIQNYGVRGIRTLGTKNAHSISNRALSTTQTLLL